MVHPKPSKPRHDGIAKDNLQRRVVHIDRAQLHRVQWRDAKRWDAICEEWAGDGDHLLHALVEVRIGGRARVDERCCNEGIGQLILSPTYLSTSFCHGW